MGSTLEVGMLATSVGGDEAGFWFDIVNISFRAGIRPSTGKVLGINYEMSYKPKKRGTPT